MGVQYSEGDVRPKWESNLRHSVGRARADMSDLLWFVLYGAATPGAWEEDASYKELARVVYEDLYFMALDRMLKIDDLLVRGGWPQTNRRWIRNHVEQLREYGERIPTKILRWWNDNYDRVMAED